MRRLFSIVKWVFGVGLVLLLVCGGAAAFLAPKIQEIYNERLEAQKGELVQVRPAEKGSLTRTVGAPGTVKPKSQVNITSRVSATIERLPFEEGDEVRAGDVVVILSSEDLKADLDAANARLLAEEASLRSAEANLASEEAALSGVKASLDRATIEFERRQELFSSGDISKSDLDDAQAELDRQRSAYEARLAALNGVRAQVEAARAGVKVAQANVDRARENLDYTTIRSPMDGVIVDMPLREGETALGTVQNIGSTIMTIADLSEMLVEARLAEIDVNAAKEGAACTVHVNGYEDRTFKGTLRRVGLQSQPSADGASYFEAEVVLDLEQGERLFAGLAANVDIEVETLEDVIVVPSQAVLDKRVEEMPEPVRTGSDLVNLDRAFARVVYVAQDGKAIMKPVTVSASNLAETAVTAGLEPGDRVIVGPFRALQKLNHDMDIRVEGEEAQEGEPAVAKATNGDTGS